MAVVMGMAVTVAVDADDRLECGSITENPLDDTGLKHVSGICGMKSDTPGRKETTARPYICI